MPGELYDGQQLNDALSNLLSGTDLAEQKPQMPGLMRATDYAILRAFVAGLGAGAERDRVEAVLSRHTAPVDQHEREAFSRLMNAGLLQDSGLTDTGRFQAGLVLNRWS